MMTKLGNGKEIHLDLYTVSERSIVRAVGQASHPSTAKTIRHYSIEKQRNATQTTGELQAEYCTLL